MSIAIYEELMSSLDQCVIACNACYHHCLEEHNAGRINIIRKCHESAEMCSFVYRSISRKSPFIDYLIEACELICKEGARECQIYEDPSCQHCAKALLACSDICAKYTS